jgi:3',5'-cyclic AMP phosphodiesterase CpdA
VSLASIEDVTLHVSRSPYLPNWRGGYFTFGRERKEFGSGDNHYEFELTGLRPGTTYYYYLKYAGRVTSEQNWTTGSADKPFRLVAYGDSQDITELLHEIHRGIVGAVYSKHPDVIIRTGDNVEDGGNMDYWRYFFAIERPVLSNAIYLPTAGNHEYWSWDGAADYFANFALPPSSPGGERYYAVKYNNALFIALNTELGSLEEQETWLKETLADAKNDPHIKWKFVFYHRPAFSSGLHGSEPGLKETWHDEFIEYGVDVVLSGHDHEYEHLLVDGVHYFVIGGAGSYLRNFQPEPLPETIYREKTYHYLVIDVNNEKLDLTAYRDNGSKMEHLVLHAPPPTL